MAALDHGAKHGTLMQMSHASDGGFGKTTTWSAIGPLRLRLTTVSSSQQLAYQRDGFENVLRIQAENFLPKRILRYKTLRDLLVGITPIEERMRINYDGRTLSIIGVRFPNDGEIHGKNSLVSIDCIETPQTVGIMDKP